MSKENSKNGRSNGKRKKDKIKKGTNRSLSTLARSDTSHLHTVECGQLSRHKADAVSQPSCKALVREAASNLRVFNFGFPVPFRFFFFFPLPSFSKKTKVAFQTVRADLRMSFFRQLTKTQDRKTGGNPAKEIAQYWIPGTGRAKLVKCVSVSVCESDCVSVGV